MEKRTGGRVSIRCAHGDVVSYALANISMEIGGRSIQLQVGVAPNLPVPVLLGTDAPELSMWLRSQGDGQVNKPGIIMTRAQWKRVEGAQVREGPKDETLQASPDVVPKDTEPRDLNNPREEEALWEQFDDDLFEEGRSREQMTRCQKRANKYAWRARQGRDRWRIWTVTGSDSREAPRLARGR